jgi:hypothetical protein
MGTARSSHSRITEPHDPRALMLTMIMAGPNTDRFFAEIQVMTQRGRVDRSDERVTNRGEERDRNAESCCLLAKPRSRLNHLRAGCSTAMATPFRAEESPGSQSPVLPAVDKPAPVSTTTARPSRQRAATSLSMAVESSQFRVEAR